MGDDLSLRGFWLVERLKCETWDTRFCALTQSWAAACLVVILDYLAATCVDETKLFICANSGRADCEPLPVDWSRAA